MKLKLLLKALVALSVVLVAVIFYFRKDIQRHAIRDSLVSYCHGKDPAESAACDKAIAERFDQCAGPLMDKKTDTKEFMACVGVAMTEPEKEGPTEVLAMCDRSRFSGTFDFFLGKMAPDAGYHAETWQGQTVYVADAASLTTDDFSSLKLLKEGAHYTMDVAFTEAGREKIKAATAAHVEEFMAIFIDHKLESFPKIMSKIGSDHAVLTLTGASKPCYSEPR